MVTNSKGLINNLVWKFAERISAQVVTLVVSIVLARILDPYDYGLIAIVTIFITIANVFVSDGLGSALIQKKDADEIDFSSVLWINLAISIVLYIILFCCAPLISKFYGNGYEILTPVMRVLGLRLIVASVNSVQQAHVSRNMIFRKFFLATLIGTLISAVVGIWMACNGFGVWALVVQYLTNTTIDTIVLALTIEMKISPCVSLKRIRKLLSFGSKILGAKLLITGFQELRTLIIGKVYSSADLAFYDKGRQFPNLLVTNIDASVGAVLFPKMVMEQGDIEAIKNTTRNSIRFSAFVMSPLMMGLAAVAENFVKLILTDKWLPCVSLLQVFCVVYLFQPIHTANMQAIKAMGRSDIYLKLEIIKKTLELVSLLLVMRISVDAIVVSMAILTTLFTFVNAYPNIKLLNYSFKEQLRDIAPSLGISLVMFTIVILVGKIQCNTMVLLMFQIIVGAFVYISICVFTKNEQLRYLYNLGINRIRKKSVSP